MDPEIQAIAEAVYEDRANLNYTSKSGQQMQSSITIIDNETGDVAAIVGRFGEKTENRGMNYANAAKRQPGSSIKPLTVYAPALEKGLLSPISVLDDYPYDTRTGSAWPLNSGGNRLPGPDHPEGRPDAVSQHYRGPGGGRLCYPSGELFLWQGQVQTGSGGRGPVWGPDHE